MTYPPPPAPSPPPPPAPSSPLSNPRGLAALGLVAVGLLGLVSGFLPWVTLSAPFVGTLSYAGTDGSDGWVAVVLGLVILFCGVVRLTRARVGAALLSVAGIASLALFGVAVWKIIDLYASIDDLRSNLGADDPYGISRAFRVSVGAGLWLMAAAGAVGVVIAAVTLWHPRLRVQPEPVGPSTPWYGQPSYAPPGQSPTLGQPQPGQPYPPAPQPGQPYPPAPQPGQPYPPAPQPGQPYSGPPQPGQPGQPPPSPWAPNAPPPPPPEPRPDDGRGDDPPPQ